jgi:Carboxypeptidase regulatory-like domain
MRLDLGCRAALTALAVVLVPSLVPSPVAAQKRPAPPQPAAPTQPPSAGPRLAAPLGRVTGVVVDSIHVVPLAGATIFVGQTMRSAISDAGGVFVVDSVPAGEHEVRVVHPLLDSLYLSLATRPFHVAADSATELFVAIPSLATLIGTECPPAVQRLGPSVFAGRVLDADTHQPAPGVRVTLVWTELAAGTDIGLRRLPRVRTGTSDARGYYRICGVPGDLDDATLQAERGRVKTAEVPVATSGAVGLRSLLIRPLADSAVTTGRAVAMGHVVDTLGMPVRDAQVSVEGAAAVTTTSASGDFSLNNLPSGTQALVVRRVGFGPSRTIVDLTAAAPVHVAARLERAVPRLNPVVVSARTEALSRVGFEERQKHGTGGHFLGPEDLEKLQPQLVTSALRTLPGLRVVPNGSGGYAVQSSRDAMGGCVSYWVDGAPFQEMQPGDLDNAFPASQIAAIEAYQPTNVPAQFTSPGQSSCTTFVIWTQASMRRRR